MSCIYPSISEKDCLGGALVKMNEHFKWIDQKTNEILAQTHKISDISTSLLGFIPAANYVIQNSAAFIDSLTIFPSITCCYGKPSTIFYPYEVYSKEDYDVRVLEWITDNFNPNDTSCNLNEMYVIAFKGYADEKAENRALMPVINYESVFDVKNNPERFIIGRFYRAGFPTLKWVLSPTLSPFGCSDISPGVSKSLYDICLEENPVTLYYYKFTSCTNPGLVFYTDKDYEYLLNNGAILDGYPNDIFLISRVVADGRYPLKSNLTVLLVTKAGCGNSCYILTNEFGESIISNSSILEAYACRNSVQLDGFTGTWTVEKTTEGCDCACIVKVAKANVDVYKLTNCCAAFLPCPDVSVKNVPKEIWVFDNTGKNYLQAGKAVELESYPGIRWSITIEAFANQKITTEYKVVDLFENCKAFVPPRQKKVKYYTLYGSCGNAFRGNLYSTSEILQPYVGKIVQINFNTKNFYLVAESISNDISNLDKVNVVNVNLYGDILPEFGSPTRVISTLIIENDELTDIELVGAEYYPSPAPNYTTEPFPACKRKFIFWNDKTITAGKGTFVFHKVQNYSKILESWYDSESWYAFTDSQLIQIIQRALGFGSLASTELYLAQNNLYIEIEIIFKRYRKLFRPSKNQLYGEETDSIGEISNVKVYSAIVNNTPFSTDLEACLVNVYKLTNYCDGTTKCVIDGTKKLEGTAGSTRVVDGKPVLIESGKSGCSDLTLFSGEISDQLSDEEAGLLCLEITRPVIGTPGEWKDLDCVTTIFYLDETNDRWHSDENISPGTRLNGYYIKDETIYSLYAGIPTEIGPACCGNEHTVYEDCCQDGAYTLYDDPRGNGMLHESINACNRAVIDNACYSSPATFIDPENSCALQQTNNCVPQVVDPFHCYTVETYSDCEDNTYELYKSTDGLYYTVKESACGCSAENLFTFAGVLGSGISGPSEANSYAFSFGVKTSSTFKGCCTPVSYDLECVDGGSITFYYNDLNSLYYEGSFSCQNQLVPLNGTYYKDEKKYEFLNGVPDVGIDCNCDEETWYYSCEPDSLSFTMYVNDAGRYFKAAAYCEANGPYAEGEYYSSETPRRQYIFVNGIKDLAGICTTTTTTPPPTTTTPAP